MFGDWRVQSIIKIVANNWQMNQCSSFSAADYSFSYYRSLTANLERFSYWLCVLVLFSFDDTVWLLHSVHPSGFNTGVFCSFDLTYSGTLIIIIIIRELLLGTHIILNVFFFFWHAGEYTLAAYQLQLLSHPSYWMKVTVSICKMTSLSSLSSLLSSHPPHQGMSQRIWHLGGEGGEQYRGRRETKWERKGQRWSQLERWVDRYLRETWEDVAWPCFLDVQDTVLKMAIELIKAQMVQEFSLYCTVSL